MSEKPNINESKNKYDDVLLYKVVRPIITVLFKILYRPKFEGREFIPSKGRVVLAGNHTNNFDCIFLISSTKRNIHFLAKDELWHSKFSFIFKNMGLIPVNRRQKDPSSLANAIEYLNHDKVIGIFPEGTFGKEKNKVSEFKIGAVKMAQETNSQIVPFAITGDYKLFSKNLKIKFLEPIMIGEDLNTENARLREIIKNIVEGEI